MRKVKILMRYQHTFQLFTGLLETSHCSFRTHKEIQLLLKSTCKELSLLKMAFLTTFSKKIGLEGYWLHSLRIEIAWLWFVPWLMRLSFKTWTRWTTTSLDLNLLLKQWPLEKESSPQLNQKHFKIKSSMEIFTAPWWVHMWRLLMKGLFQILRTLGATCVNSSAGALKKNVMKSLLHRSKSIGKNKTMALVKKCSINLLLKQRKKPYNCTEKKL